MSTSKRSATGATNLNTGRLTSPIVFKIMAAFATLSLLGLIVTLFSLLNLSRSGDSSRELLALQDKAQLSNHLMVILKQQQEQAQLVLFQGRDPAEFEEAHQKLSYELFFKIDNDALSTRTLFDKEREFIALYDQTRKALEASRPPSQAKVSAELDALTNNMVVVADNLNKTFLSQSQIKLEELNKSQQEAFNLTLVLSFIALALTAGVIWFVIASIMQPLNRMNEQLSQLLWSQNEHLTERLNLLQQDINTNNEMLTAVRHDLKAPLSSMKGLAELSIITQPNLPAELSQNLNKIVEVADNSVETINNLLTRREIKLEMQTVSLQELIDKVLRLVDLRWFNITRKVEATYAVMDPGLMEHALLNLVSNARKFSGGGIGIGVNKVTRAGTVDEEELEFWVWNDGSIITAGDREEIFKPGKQLEDGKKAGGHGLGLAIVKSIAERHHGRVLVESHEKKGTTFRIIIPVPKIAEYKSASSQPATGPEQIALPLPHS